MAKKLKSCIMRFTLTYKNLKPSRSIAVYAREKIAKLFAKLLKDPAVTQAVTIDIEFSRMTKHHRKGMVWKVDTTVILPGRKEPLYAEVTDEDIHSAVDILAEELEREIQKYKGKLIALYKRGARVAKKELRLDPAARLYRRGRIRDEGN